MVFPPRQLLVIMRNTRSRLCRLSLLGIRLCRISFFMNIVILIVVVLFIGRTLFRRRSVPFFTRMLRILGIRVPLVVVLILRVVAMVVRGRRNSQKLRQSSVVGSGQIGMLVLRMLRAGILAWTLLIVTRRGKLVSRFTVRRRRMISLLFVLLLRYRWTLLGGTWTMVTSPRLQLRCRCRGNVFHSYSLR